MNRYYCYKFPKHLKNNSINIKCYQISNNNWIHIFGKKLNSNMINNIKYIRYTIHMFYFLIKRRYWNTLCLIGSLGDINNQWHSTKDELKKCCTVSKKMCHYHIIYNQLQYLISSTNNLHYLNNFQHHQYYNQIHKCCYLILRIIKTHIWCKKMS